VAAIQRRRFSRHHVLPLVVFFAGLFALLMESKSLENTIQVEGLVLLACVPGLVIGVALAKVARRALTALPSQEVGAAQALLVFGTLCIFIVLASYANRTGGSAHRYSRVLLVTDGRTSAKDGPWTDVVWDGHSERLSVSSSVFKHVKAGARQVEGTYFQCQLGFTVVEAISTSPGERPQQSPPNPRPEVDSQR
jgi:hypothetical protein